MSLPMGTAFDFETLDSPVTELTSHSVSGNVGATGVSQNASSSYHGHAFFFFSAFAGGNAMALRRLPNWLRLRGKTITFRGFCLSTNGVNMNLFIRDGQGGDNSPNGGGTPYGLLSVSRAIAHQNTFVNVGYERGGISNGDTFRFDNGTLDGYHLAPERTLLAGASKAAVRSLATYR